MRRTAILLLLIAAPLALGVAASAQTPRGSTQSITGAGAGGVRVGATYSSLRKKQLIGTLRHGCELAGPNERYANLRRPLRGSVTFTQSSPRKVRAIAINGGAAARGVGIGDSLEDIQEAFDRVTINRTTETVFQITLVTVPKSSGGRFEFAIDVDSERISLIGIPRIEFCE